MLKDKELKKLQECELLIATEIKRICESNNIRFFMVCGTMLGAVRHSGFIPWDDDMDFGIPFDDYIRFTRLCKTELKPEFEFQDWDTDSDYPYPFGKVRLKNTAVDETFAAKDSAHKGIFVDVFPVVNLKNGEQFRRKVEKKNSFLTKTLWIKKGYGKTIREEGFFQRVKYDVFSLISFFSSYEKTKKKYKELLSGLNASDSDEMMMICSSYSLKQLIVKKEWAENLADYTFENEIFPGFKDYDKYLSTIYGSYMIIPPEEKRHTHEIEHVDFGDY